MTHFFILEAFPLETFFAFGLIMTSSAIDKMFEIYTFSKIGPNYPLFSKIGPKFAFCSKIGSKFIVTFCSKIGPKIISAFCSKIGQKF